jgi:hypothetical protein
MDDKKTKYRKEYLKNKEKLIEYGKKYYNERIYPKVEIEVKHGDFRLFFDYGLFQRILREI